MRAVQEPAPITQRVKVGVTGLAIVLLLMSIAGALFRWVNHASTVTRPDTIGNAADANAAAPGEPLAEIGVAPSGQGNTASSESGARRP